MAVRATNAQKITHNSLWYGLETVIETVVFFGTSIAVARYLGPAKLGYFSYINFFVSILTRTSGTGISTATRKYMSEFIALDRMGTARAVYTLAHRYQLISALLISTFGVLGIVLWGDPPYKLMASILIISLVPGIMSWVPAQANQAFEDVSNNTLSAFGYIIVYTVVIALTIHYRWDLVGVASASLVGRTAEVFLRTIPLNRKMRKLPLDTLDADVIYRIRRFCVQAVGLQLLMSVVWDRSEMVFLRKFSTLEQTAFYSISFTFASNLLTLPRVFGSATGITLMVEASRDPKRVNSIVRNSCRYLLLATLPISLGAIAVTLPAIRVAYGTRYLGAVPVLIIASMLAIPRAFQGVPEILMRTADRQNRILVWYSVIGVFNLILDYLFIPHHGAIGAAWGNGIAQSVGVYVIWRQGKSYFPYTFPINSAIRITLASSLMAGAAYFIGRATSGIAGLMFTVFVASVIYVVLVKVFRGLEPSDRERLAPIGERLPPSARRFYHAVLAFVTPEPV